MKISVFATIPPGIYSGGRYLSLMLAYALSRAGAEVTYVTNNAPLFGRDFEPYEQTHPVRTIVSPKFQLPADLVSDWVVVVPTGGFNGRFYNAVIDHARSQRARVALLSFETPNWYAAMSPFPRSPMPIESWRQVVASGGLIMTIAREGIVPARAYFGEGDPERPRRYAHWHPAINDLAAAEAPPPPARRRKIVMFARTEDLHKGAQDLLALPPRLFEGHVLSLVFGRGVNEDYVGALRRHFAPAQAFAIEVLSQITDKEKFVLLSQACLMLFPSYFEGYGYPPVEAAWMGVPTVAYDLPLLREVAGEAIWTAPPGDTAAFAQLVRRSLAERRPGPEIAALMKVSTDTLTSGQSFLASLQAAAPYLHPAGPEPAAVAIQDALPGLNAPARAMASHHAGGIEIYAARATLAQGRISVTGTIEGLREAASLQISVPGGSMPRLDLAANGGRSLGFLAEGVLGTWPELAASLELGLCLIRQDGTRVDLGTVPLDPDATALLSHAADGGALAAEDVLVVADPRGIAASALTATALCELVGVVEGRGGRVALVYPRSAVPVLPTGRLNLLPRFAAVLPMEQAVLGGVVARALADGRPVVASPALAAAAGLDPARALALDLADEGTARLLVFPGRVDTPEGTPAETPDKTLAGPVRLVPDARRWGRNARAAQRTPTVVLLCAAPIAQLDPGLARLLRRLRAAMGSACRFVIPAALSATRASLRDGLATVVEPVSPADLHALLDRGGVAGLSLGPHAAETAELLAAYRVPVFAAVTGVVAEPGPAPDVAPDVAADLLAWFHAQDAAPPGSLAAVLQPLLGPAPAPRTLAGLQVGRPATVPVGEPSLPQILAGDALSLSGTRGARLPGLLTGWKTRSVLGASMEGDTAVLGFRVVVPRRERLAALELMLHISPTSEQALSISVVLNDHHLGVLTKLPVGASTHRLATPDGVWTDDQQTVMLRCRWAGPRVDALRVTLIALSPQVLPVPVPAWNSIAKNARRLVPLHTRTQPQIDARQSARFGIGASPGFLRLTSGWSPPEPDLNWSSERLCAIGFAPPMLSETPVLLTLEGECFGTLQPGSSGLVAQRLRISHNRTPIAEVTLPLARAPVSVALPSALTVSGVSHLTFEFPDAVSPKDALLGDDDRTLGLALMAAASTVMPELAGSAAVEPPRTGGPAVARASLTVAPGVLRISGSDSPPRDTRFTLTGSDAVAWPVAQAAGGWDVSLALTGAILAGARIELICLTAESGPSSWPDTLQVWSDPAEAGTGRQDRRTMDVAILARRDLHEDIRDSLTGGFGSGIDAGLEAPESAPQSAPQPEASPETLDTGGQDAESPVSETPGFEPPAPALLALPCDFPASGGQADPRMLVSGWSDAEADGIWTEGDRAVLGLTAPVGPAVVTLEVDVFAPLPHLRQRASLSANGHVFASLVLTRQVPLTLRMVLPDACTPARQIELALADAVSPLQLGLSGDPRLLSLRLRRLHLSAPPAPGTLTEAVWAETGGRVPFAVMVRPAGEDVCVVVSGKAPMPLGIARAAAPDEASNEASGATVIAHAVPTRRGWSATLLIPAADIAGGPDGSGQEASLLLRVLPSGGDPDVFDPGNVLRIVLPVANETGAT